MRVFVAGATGATGQVFVPVATEAGLDLRLHVRPATAPRVALGNDPRARIFDLSDAAALRGALAPAGEPRVDAIVSLVGTMKRRFGAGDTYASSDIGSTVALVDAAKAVGVPQFLLLSSVGAGGSGAYLQMKGECERIVRESGLRWTIFRPSALASPADAVGSHGARWVPPGGTLLTRALRGVPGVGPLVARYGPIPIEVLVRAMVSVLTGPLGADGVILEGEALWDRGA